MRLLSIEDELAAITVLRDHLDPYFIVDSAQTGKRGLYLAQICEYDLILLDLGLSDMNGQYICRQLRINKIKTPIIVVTAQKDVRNKAVLLNDGADDYLIKPFSFGELMARIRALLRRNPETSYTNLLMADDIILDPDKRTTTCQGRSIYLRPKEFELLEYFMRHKQQVLTVRRLLDHVWVDSSQIYSNAINVHIKALRDQIDRPYKRRLIRTIHGVGFMLDA